MNVTDAVSCARQVARGSKLPQDDICGTVVKVYLPHIFGKMPKDERAVLIRDMQDTGIFWLDTFNPGAFGYVLMPLAG